MTPDLARKHGHQGQGGKDAPPAASRVAPEVGAALVRQKVELVGIAEQGCFSRDDLCRELGIPHPDYLTAEQLNDWLEHHQESPLSPLRDDLRMEVFRIRLLDSFAGGESSKDIPGPIWPYKSINEETDWEAVINEAERLNEELVDDGSGTGRMKWKE